MGLDPDQLAKAAEAFLKSGFNRPTMTELAVTGEFSGARATAVPAPAACEEAVTGEDAVAGASCAVSFSNSVTVSAVDVSAAG